MRKLMILSAALWISVESAQAQVLQRPRYQSPSATTSPYLNMLRGGNPAMNYYGGVRSQNETSQSLQNLQQQMMMSPGSNAMGVMQPPPDQMGPVSQTGHPVAFFNTKQYFPVVGGRPSTGSAGAGGGNTGIGTANPLSLGLAFTGNGPQPVINFNRR